MFLRVPSPTLVRSPVVGSAHGFCRSCTKKTAPSSVRQRAGAVRRVRVARRANLCGEGCLRRRRARPAPAARHVRRTLRSPQTHVARDATNGPCRDFESQRNQAPHRQVWEQRPPSDAQQRQDIWACTVSQGKGCETTAARAQTPQHMRAVPLSKSSGRRQTTAWQHASRRTRPAGLGMAPSFGSPGALTLALLCASGRCRTCGTSTSANMSRWSEADTNASFL